jgi:hypothetical protein
MRPFVLLKIAWHSLIKICDSNFEPLLRKRQLIGFSTNCIITCGNKIFLMTFTSVHQCTNTIQWKTPHPSYLASILILSSLTAVRSFNLSPRHYLVIFSHLHNAWSTSHSSQPHILTRIQIIQMHLVLFCTVLPHVLQRRSFLCTLKAFKLFIQSFLYKSAYFMDISAVLVTNECVKFCKEVFPS